MQSAIARTEGVLLIVVGVYLGGATLAICIHTFLTIAAPVPTLVATNVILAILTAAVFYTARRLLSRPDLLSMKVGGALLITVGIWQTARFFGAELDLL